MHTELRQSRMELEIMSKYACDLTEAGFEVLVCEPGVWEY